MVEHIMKRVNNEVVSRVVIRLNKVCKSKKKSIDVFNKDVRMTIGVSIEYVGTQV